MPVFTDIDKHFTHKMVVNKTVKTGKTSFEVLQSVHVEVLVLLRNDAGINTALRGKPLIIPPIHAGSRATISTFMKSRAKHLVGTGGSFFTKNSIGPPSMVADNL